MKLSLFRTNTDPIPDYRPESRGGMEGNREGGVSECEGVIGEDEHFVSWSPSAVWEMEKRAYLRGAGGGGGGGMQVNREELMESSDLQTSDHLESLNDVGSTGSPRNDIVHDHTMSSPTIIGTVTLDAVAQATARKLSDCSPVEILGPVEYVWGHPLTVHVATGNEGVLLSRPECRVLTMLYRR